MGPGPLHSPCDEKNGPEARNCCSAAGTAVRHEEAGLDPGRLDELLHEEPGAGAELSASKAVATAALVGTVPGVVRSRSRSRGVAKKKVVRLVLCQRSAGKTLTR